ncbi:DeoR/GlpR family DNA-binding transcription regulator [Ligilactobacillus sp.]|uniref:DeoR/GlpR family DNA-binding transcription regulator n=1 Tax=Ligilactobacillus sp. TaxID=2767921 RepID=UPI002FE0085A
MLKKERLIAIQKAVDEKGIINVNELIEMLNVSDMTIRRDLDELAKAGRIHRIHGGAQRIDNVEDLELTRNEKTVVNSELKEQVARKAAGLIVPGDTVYLGPGTTVEPVIRYVRKPEQIRIVTNSLPVFEAWKNTGAELVLIGGSFRRKSGAFIGGLAEQMLRELKFTKAFVSANGINDENVMTANAEEGQTQAVALNNAQEKIMLLDETKFNRNDFYRYYNLYNMDRIVTSDGLSDSTFRHYSTFTEIIR